MGTDRHRITLEQAVALTAAYRKSRPDGPHAWRFDRSAFESLLAVPGMAGIRIYSGHDARGATLVMVATDIDGRDLVSDYLAEEADMCPPYCDSSSPLAG